MTWQISYRRIGNPYRYEIVGCDVCGRRLHVDSYGAMRKHNKEKGVECEGSFVVSNEGRRRFFPSAQAPA